MPRAQKSQAAGITEFFRSTTIEVAEFAVAQILEILKERRAKSKAAKDRAKKPQATVGGPAPIVAAPRPAAVRKVTAKAKKKSHKKGTKPAVVAAVTESEPGLPLQEAPQDQDAGDLVGTLT